MRTETRKPFLTAIVTTALLAACMGPAQAGDRMYFAGLVEENADTGNPQVLLVWGPYENQIPDEITGFRLYRKPAAGSFSLIAETSRELVEVPTLAALFQEPGEGARQTDLENWAPSPGS